MQFRQIFVFRGFRNCRALEGGINAHRRCTALQRPRHDIADFGVIWGRFFFDQKSTFSISISIKSGLAVVWSHFRSIFFCALFFPLRQSTGAGPKNNSVEFGGWKAPNPQKHENSTFFFQNPAILGIASRKRVIFDRVTPCFATVSDFFSHNRSCMQFRYIFVTGPLGR